MQLTELTFHSTDIYQLTFELSGSNHPKRSCKLFAALKTWRLYRKQRSRSAHLGASSSRVGRCSTRSGVRRRSGLGESVSIEPPSSSSRVDFGLPYLPHDDIHRCGNIRRTQDGAFEPQDRRPVEGEASFWLRCRYSSLYVFK